MWQSHKGVQGSAQSTMAGIEQDGSHYNDVLHSIINKYLVSQLPSQYSVCLQLEAES